MQPHLIMEDLLMAPVRLHVLDCGAMSCDLTWLLLKAGRTIRSRAERDRPVEWYPCTTHAVVVETPEGRMLWDTSCPRDWEQRWAPTGLQEFFPYDQVSEEQYFDSRLAQLKLGLEDIDFVVMSHLHFDHAGNVALFKNTQARLICHEAEKRFAFGFEGIYTGAHLKTDYQGLDFETVSGDTEFLPGVTLLEAPGHTPGTMALKVDLAESGTMIFTSDALYMGDSYGPPATPAAIVHDLSAWYSSVEKLRTIAEATNASVIFGHDAAQMRSMRLAPHGSYR